jgi:hypothetical protein
MRYAKAVAVTKSDTVDIAPGSVFDGLFVVGTGNIVVVLEDNSTITVTALAANTLLPFAVKRVNSTGTSATGIYALKF